MPVITSVVSGSSNTLILSGGVNEGVHLTGSVFFKNAAKFGGGYGDTGVTITAAGAIAADGNLTTGGNITVGGNIAGDADESKTIFAETTTASNTITIGGGGDVAIGGTGDLKLSSTGYINDAGGHVRFTATDAGATILSDADGTTVVTVHASDLSTTLAGSVSVAGNIAGDADENKTIFAETTTASNTITIGGGGKVVAAGDLQVSATGSFLGVQIGTDYDGTNVPHTGYPLRVSDANDDVGITIDAGNNKTASLIFSERSLETAAPGWFVDHSADQKNRASWRTSNEEQGQGAIVIHNDLKSVRIGGGDLSGDGYDAESLIITSSDYRDPSMIRLRTKHGERSKEAFPVVSWLMETAGGANAGHWVMGIDPYSTHDGDTAGEYLKINASSPASSTMMSNTTAMTFRAGGNITRVGVGGDSTSRALIPSATFHIENQQAAAYSMTKTLESSQLFIGNSSTNSNFVSAGIYLDASSDDNVNKHSAHILAVRTSEDSDDHTSYVSIGLYDGSGNNNSTRSRLRIDDQGGVLLISGTNAAAGAGWPKPEANNNEVNVEVPSGSLTLLSNVNQASQPTLNFVAWPSNAYASRAIAAGQEMGRISWWSSDTDLSEGDRVGAYIEAVATDTHSAVNKAAMKLDFYVRGMAIGAPRKAITIDGYQKLITHGDLQVVGNDIQDSSGTAAITFDGSQNTKFGGNIAGKTDTVLSMSSDLNMVFTIDHDGDTGNHNFVFQRGENEGVHANTVIATLNQDGDLQIDGALTVGKTGTAYSYIKDSSGTNVFAFAGDGTVDGPIKISTTNALQFTTAGGYLYDAAGHVVLTLPGAGAAGATISGRLVADGGIDIDNITLDGNQLNQSSGDFTFDVAGDIILDAAGNQIRLKDAGSERIVFLLNSTPEMQSTGALTISSSAGITLDSTGVDIDVLGSHQLKLSYDGSSYTTFETTGAGDLIVNPTNDIFQIEGDAHVQGPTGAAAVVQIGVDSDGQDRKVTFGHSTLKSVIGVYDTTNVFAINTDATFETDNDFEIDASGNVTVNNGTFTIGSGATSDTVMLFDGNERDYRIGLDDGTNALEFGEGATHGTSTSMLIHSGAYAGPAAIQYPGGLRYSAATQVNSATSSATDKWIRFARMEQAGITSDTSASSFLVTICGYETVTGVDWTFRVHAKFTGASNSSGYDADGTYLIVESIRHTNMGAWDPTVHIKMLIPAGNATGMREPELWIMSPASYKDLFVTHYGGTLATDSGPSGTSAITDPGFVICSGQAWLADAVHPNGTANTVYGQWAAPAVHGLMVSGSDWSGPSESPSLKVVEAANTSANRWIKIARTNGITSNQDTTSGIFLVEFTGREYSDSYDGDASFIVRAKYTAFTSDPGYYATGTSLTLEALTAENLHDFDPTKDTKMTFDGEYAEVWMKSLRNYKFPTVTHLGGTTVTDDATYDGPGWRVAEAYDGAWGATHTSINPWNVNYDQGGVWATKRAKEIRSWSCGADCSTSAETYLPISGQYFTDSTTLYNQAPYTFIAHASGRLFKVVAACETASGNTAFDFYKVTGGISDAAPATTQLGSVIVNVTTADKAYAWDFTTTSSTFAAGDVLAISIDGNVAPNQVLCTIVFEFDIPSITVAI